MGGACSTREMRIAYKMLAGQPDGRDHSEYLGADVKITLKWILAKQGGKVWTGHIWLRIEANAGLLWMR
jgi:hypothetical protein